jgi:hypothetical protein
MQLQAHNRNRLAALAWAVLSPISARARNESESAGESLRRDEGAASLWNPQDSDLTLPKTVVPTFPEVSWAPDVKTVESKKPSASAASSPDGSIKDLDEIVELSKTGIVSSFKKFLRENLFGALITAGVVMYGAVRSFFRIFPNKIHLDAFVLGRLPRQDGEQEGRHVFHAQTLKVSTLSEIFGANLPALVSFNLAMWRARNSLFWPTMVFSNNKVLRTMLHGGPHEIISRPFRSVLSSLFSDSIFPSCQAAAEKRQGAIDSGTDRGKFQAVSGSFVVCTYERVCDIQPRAYLIPQQDVVNFLLMLPELYHAAKDTPGEAMRRLVRVLEICGSLVARYPTALKSLGLGEKLPQAAAVANDIYRMYALEPEESVEFLRRYVEGDRSHIEPTESEKRRMRELWYGTKDEARQLQCEEVEQNMESFFHYGRECAKHGIPVWLFMLSLPTSTRR